MLNNPCLIWAIENIQSYKLIEKQNQKHLQATLMQLS